MGDIIKEISIITTILLYILIILIQIRAQQKKTDISKLTISLGFLATGNFIVTITSDPYLYSLGNGIFVLGLLILFLHYEAIANEKPKSVLFYILSGIFLLSTICTIVVLWLLNFPEVMVVLRQRSFETKDFLMYPLLWLFDFSSILIGMVVFLRAIQIIIRVHKLAHLPATRNEIIALFCLFLNSFFTIPLYYSSSVSFKAILAFMSILVSVLGIIIIMYTYLRYPDYLYLLPFPIHSFMMYNKDGMLCYSRKVQQKKLGMEEKDLLISGAFTAISSLITETLGKQAKIRHINAQQFQIFFKEIPGDKGTFVVIAYGNTSLFEKSLKRFTNILTPTFYELLNEAGIEMSKLEQEIDGLLKKAFPYVIMENK